MLFLSIFFWIVPASGIYAVKKDGSLGIGNAVELLTFGLMLFIANVILMFIPFVGWSASCA